MKKEESFGIIPLQKQEDRWMLCLVQLHDGHWGFPKGHLEKGETPLEGAMRELTEETGLNVTRFLSDSAFDESYRFKVDGELVKKTVVYFLAEVAGEIKIQKKEIAKSCWVPLKGAEKSLTFDETKSICQEIQELLV